MKSILFVVVLAAQSLFAERVMLVVPARFDMVNLGFDLMEMLPGSIDMACYKGYASLMRLEFYNSVEGRWVTLPGESLVKGAEPFDKAKNLVFVGEDPIAVYLVKNIAWAEKTAAPSGHYLHEVANAVHSFCPLTEKQWDKLASPYGFRLKKEPARSWYDEAENRHEDQRTEMVPVVEQKVEETVVPEEKAVLKPVAVQPDKTLRSPFPDEDGEVRFHVIGKPEAPVAKPAVVVPAVPVAPAVKAPVAKPAAPAPIEVPVAKPAVVVPAVPVAPAAKPAAPAPIEEVPVAKPAVVVPAVPAAPAVKAPAAKPAAPARIEVPVAKPAVVVPAVPAAPAVKAPAAKPAAPAPIEVPAAKPAVVVPAVPVAPVVKAPAAKPAAPAPIEVPAAPAVKAPAAPVVKPVVPAKDPLSIPKVDPPVIVLDPIVNK